MREAAVKRRSLTGTFVPCFPPACGFPTRTYASSSSSWTPTRSFLEKSLALDSEVVALTIEDRERILWALTMSARTRWQSSGPFCSKSTRGACATGSCSSAA